MASAGQVTAAAAAVAAASAYVGLFKLLPVDRAYQYAAEVKPVPQLPAYPGPDFRLPPNFGGGTLIDTLA
ncbi:MAG TPA: hypothetical protein VMQ11_06000 [Alphaproteobacteria bacterium]|nr:hypothetical protein [Alphaproteobacteria bacterium]